MKPGERYTSLDHLDYEGCNAHLQVYPYGGHIGIRKKNMETLLFSQHAQRLHEELPRIDYGPQVIIKIDPADTFDGTGPLGELEN